MEPPPTSFVAPTAPPASSLPPPIAPPPQLHPTASSVAPADPPAPAVALAAPAVGVKRRHAGQPVLLPQPALAVSSVARVVAAPKVRKKPSLGPKGAATPKVKKTTSRKKPTPAPAAPSPAPPPVVHEVDYDEEEEGEDQEEVTEIEEEAFAAIGKPTMRSKNNSEAQDILLVHAWAHVGLDASTGTDHTGKRYWQRIEDVYCKIKPKTGGYTPRRYRSLQGRWELMNPHCARWSAAMDQVKDAPPSGTVESDYEAIAELRYKKMATLKGKAFPFKHVWKILQTYDKWKLRDQETAPKKSAMLRMEDIEEEGSNEHKPVGNKNDKLRKKMQGEVSRKR
ncbi:putative methionyl-tRNA synthetase [Hordeum vulgare]|nr:putative methionyl-tRNA synthetase [Hordeum vulgare]